MTCLLCGSRDILEQRLPLDGRDVGYCGCRECDFLFMRPEDRLQAVDEKHRYELHENDPSQEGYRGYVQPLVDVMSGLYPPGSLGLDYGAGPRSAAHRMLVERGFAQIAQYDPYFAPETPLPESHFDFVYACEVVEHFHDPRSEFARLRRLLKPGGTLAFMTALRTPETDFAHWHYRRDPTHVGFFSARTCDWIAEAFKFTDLKMHGPRTVTMRRPFPDRDSAGKTAP